MGYFTPEDLVKYKSQGGNLVQTEEINVSELKKRLDENSVFLLDVRRSSELKEIGYIKGAYNIAHTRLLYKINEIPRDKPVMVQCRTGNRSRYASAFLEKQGYTTANVAGGIFNWMKSGELVEKD